MYLKCYIKKDRIETMYYLLTQKSVFLPSLLIAKALWTILIDYIIMSNELLFSRSPCLLHTIIHT